MKNTVQLQTTPSTTSTTVYNLANPNMYLVYSLPPREAVRNAYAQEVKKDFNTWDYAKYDNLVVEGKKSVSCGDFAALK